MEKNNFVLMVSLAILLVIPLIFAIPQSFTINGRLTNPNGVALEGSYTMNFSIWDALTGGNALWSSSQSVTTDSNGVYSVILNPSGLNFSDNYFLEIKVGSETLSPRMNLTSSPYSFRSQNISIRGVEFDATVDLGSQDLITTGKIGIGSGASSPQQALHIDTGEVNIIGNIGASLTDAPDVLTVTGGTGGAGSSGTPGKGSDILFTTGQGGAATYPGVTVGSGGDFNITTGIGATFSSSTYSQSPGTGGDFIITTGEGSSDSDAAAVGGAGGNIELTTGAGGSGATPGPYGNVILVKNGGNTYINTSSDLGYGVLQVQGNALVKGNLNVTGTSYLGTMTLESGNITADYFIGDGSKLSNVNITSDYAKYQFTNNNFNGTGNFTTTGRIGIGTETPTMALDIFNGEVNITGSDGLGTSGADAPDVLTVIGGQGAYSAGTGGQGSEILLTLGTGGTGSAGGLGGDFEVTAGTGGTVTTVGSGGAGGKIILTGGTGGAGGTMGGNGGAGGDIELTAGLGGSAPAGASGTQGNIILNASQVQILTDLNVTGTSYLGDVNVSGNTIGTLTSNVTITSAGGSVIIRLG